MWCAGVQVCRCGYCTSIQVANLLLQGHPSDRIINTVIDGSSGVTEQHLDKVLRWVGARGGHQRLDWLHQKAQILGVPLMAPQPQPQPLIGFKHSARTWC